MKPLIIIFFSIISLLSCRNGEEKPAIPVTNDTANSEKVLLKKIVQYPDSALLQEELIQYYRDIGNYDEAVFNLGEIIKVDSMNARLWEMKGILFFENGDTSKSINAYERAVYLLPAPGYMMALGSLYAQTRNEKALLVADVLLQDKNVDHSKEALFIKGLYYTYTNEKIKAINYFNTCLDIDYTFMYAYREKAIAFYDIGKYHDAVTVLKKAITLQNNFDEGYYWLGQCYEKLNKKDEAVEAYKNALIYSPDYIEAKEALQKLMAE